MPKIALMSGSIRRESANSAVISTVGRILRRSGGENQVCVISPRDFPLFDEDLEGTGGSERLRAARWAVAEADVLIISSPAYNGYPSGVLKNALDWLSRPGPDGETPPLSGKLTALISASPGRSGGNNAHPHLRQIIANCGGVPFEYEPVAIGNAVELRGADGLITDIDAVARLTGLVEALLTYHAEQLTVAAF